MSDLFGDRDLRIFRGRVLERLGLQFEDARFDVLAEVLQRRLEATSLGVGAYLDHLGSDWKRDEIGALARELTVPETYFFRNLDQFRAFAERVLPERLAAAAGRKLRILSAGCASGEEPYSIAIVAREAIGGRASDVAIQAIDLNSAMIRKAERARYSSWAFRDTAPEMRDRWFRREGAELVLDEAVRRGVDFHERNLVDDDPEFWRPQTYDVVFCRNVIMYFSTETARAVMSRIAEALVPGGYLFLGHAETLRGLSQDFHLCHTHGTFYYQRKDRVEGTFPRPRSRREPPVPLLTSDAGDAEAWIATIGRSAERIELLTRAPSPPPAATARFALQADIGSALDLLSRERFDQALGLVESFPTQFTSDPDVLLLRAALLVHMGRLDAAEKVSRALLDRDEMSAGAHHVLALCREGGGDRLGAIEQHRIAAYLDPSFAMPRLHLGLLARRDGDHESARRELGHAFDLLQREDAARLLLFGGGFNRDALLALCRAELETCGDEG